MGAFAPYDNASLAFKVYSSFAVDSKTGNRVPVNSTENYTANIQLQPNKSDQKPGVDENEMVCKGPYRPSRFHQRLAFDQTY